MPFKDHYKLNKQIGTDLLTNEQIKSTLILPDLAIDYFPQTPKFYFTDIVTNYVIPHGYQ